MRAAAVRMRSRGVAYKAIARDLGVSVSWAHDNLKTVAITDPPNPKLRPVSKLPPVVPGGSSQQERNTASRARARVIDAIAVAMARRVGANDRLTVSYVKLELPGMKSAPTKDLETAAMALGIRDRLETEFDLMAQEHEFDGCGQATYYWDRAGRMLLERELDGVDGAPIWTVLPRATNFFVLGVEAVGGTLRSATSDGKSIQLTFSGNADVARRVKAGGGFNLRKLATTGEEGMPDKWRMESETYATVRDACMAMRKLSNRWYGVDLRAAAALRFNQPWIRKPTRPST